MCDTIKEIKSLCDKMKTKKRSITMYLLGITIGQARYPKFEIDNKLHMLPRPFVQSRPKSDLKKIIKWKWFCHLLQLMEKITYEHVVSAFQIEDGVSFFYLRQKLDFCKKEIPSYSRVCNTFFTQVAIL